MTENKRFVDYFDKDHNYIIQDLVNEDEYQVGFVNCDEDEFLELVNKLVEENRQLKKENKFLRCTIESNSQDDYIDYLEKQNERLKERITELASNDKIVFIKGQY